MLEGWKWKAERLGGQGEDRRRTAGTGRSPHIFNHLAPSPPPPKVKRTFSDRITSLVYAGGKYDRKYP